MRVLGDPKGTFDFLNSDHNVGSNFLKDDLLSIYTSNFEIFVSNLNFKDNFIDETEIRKNWYSFTRASFDELILAAIIKKYYPDARIQHQVKWGKKQIDLVITHKSDTKLLEFHGPNHFSRYRYRDPKNPLLRKQEAEEFFIDQFDNIEYVIWPYWIQQCERNVRVIFEPDIQGLGVLWSTNTLFNDFVYPRSAEMIDKITKRFNALRNDSYGYFYGPDTENRNNPEHPIIDKIRKGRKNKEVLVPKGAKDQDRWLPDEFHT